MSVMHLVQILCDHGEDCELDDAGQWIGITTARRYAAGRGWTTREVDGQIQDFCPEHSKHHLTPTLRNPPIPDDDPE